MCAPRTAAPGPGRAGAGPGGREGRGRPAGASGRAGVFPGRRGPRAPPPPGAPTPRPRGSVLGRLVPRAGGPGVPDPLLEEAVGPSQTPEWTLTKNKQKASLSHFAALRICHLGISKRLRRWMKPHSLSAGLSVFVNGEKEECPLGCGTGTVEGKMDFLLPFRKRSFLLCNSCFCE